MVHISTTPTALWVAYWARCQTRVAFLGLVASHMHILNKNIFISKETRQRGQALRRLVQTTGFISLFFRINVGVNVNLNLYMLGSVETVALFLE